MHVDSEVGRECKTVSESLKIATKRHKMYMQMPAKTDVLLGFLLLEL